MMAADKNILFIPKFEENLWKKLPTQRLFFFMAEFKVLQSKPLWHN